MPQVFLVLKCYKCLVFQVHQSKKSNKFTCKMCGEKQSIKRHYGIGNGQECRMHVQKLNGIRGKLDESNSIENIPSSDEDNNIPSPVKTKLTNTKSKWSDFVEKEDIIEKLSNEDTDKMFLEDTEVVLDVPKKKRQKRFTVNQKYPKSYSKSKPVEIAEFAERGNNLDNMQDSISKPSNEYQKINDFQTIASEKSLLKHGYVELTQCSDDLENINNAMPQNISKEIKVPKFIPPTINPNSKWSKFTDYETNSSQNEIDEKLSPTFTESQPESEVNIGVPVSETFDLDNDNSSLLNFDGNESILSRNHSPSECTLKPLNGRNSLEVNLGNESEIKVDVKRNFNVDTQSQKDVKNLFALCNDNEIDEILNI